MALFHWLKLFQITGESADTKFVWMGDGSASYIHMVQHLIEKCLIFRMSKDECMDALSKHANIKPVITSTVWNELVKENREFFQSYSESRMSKAETNELIQKIISDHQANGSDSDDDK